jgi:hypothetical protein
MINIEKGVCILNILLSEKGKTDYNKILIKAQKKDVR